ncbi:flavin reductase family protein [Variovorax sp. dw_954]|uniref:flavin reductase family protein n=1 Tax=Variovorax sp. dw_954 TaxID=2720078 RepID=UPI001BD47275|nr:flavin reductase family protein [Variovorax sp. dw_954]
MAAILPDSEQRTMNSIEPSLFRSVMGRFATGVTVVSYHREGRPAGMTANAFLSVSLDPPLVLVSVRRNSQFTTHVRHGSRYGVNLLAESQQDLSSHFGGRSVEGMPIPFMHSAGTPLIDGSLAHIVARVVDIHSAGDHLLYIGEIEHLSHGTDASPLIFYGGNYRQVHTHAKPAVQWQSTDGW